MLAQLVSLSRLPRRGQMSPLAGSDTVCLRYPESQGLTALRSSGAELGGDRPLVANRINGY